MKVKIVIIAIIISLINITLILAGSKSNKDSINVDGVYAMTLDGKRITTFPTKGAYKVDVSCENATGKWLYNDWKLLLENITGEVSCYIDFNSMEKKYFNDYIMKLEKTTSTQESWKVVNENGYRYEGKGPDNYVYFNNEYWRIIGVFDSSSHGVENKNLVKIIRENPIDALSWDKSTNEWTTSTLNTLLNGIYYNALDGSDTDYCYKFAASVKSKCNYTIKGIQSSYRPMVKKVTWYLGGYSSNDITLNEAYQYERSSNVYSGRSTVTNNYIGLMYYSDYLYSTLAADCSRDKYFSTSNFGYTCASKNWLTGKGMEWTIVPWTLTSSTAIYINAGGDLGNYYGTGLVASVRPVLYLDESVYVIDGDGSILNPYIIGM